MHIDNKIENPNLKLAFEYTKKAANIGLIDAQLLLGLLYINGIGTISSTKEGLFWLKKSASSDNAEAYYQLGIFKSEDYFAGSFIRDFLGENLFKK